MPPCSALVITAPASGQGKTTVTAALARLHSQLGRRVQVFKCGPDFLDPQIHALASGQPCENLDLWMCGLEDGRWRLSRAAADHDLILIEGAMGLFDGEPSTADIAQTLQLPMLAIIDGSRMAQTFGAIAHGLRHYRPGTALTHVLANRVGSARHAQMLENSLPADIHWWGHLPRENAASLPERHLGLLPAAEIDDLLDRIDCMASHLQATAAAQLPPAVEFPAPAMAALPPLLRGQRIAIARDAAYCFIYPANLECLRALGAELNFFSPLAGAALPECDAVWLPGGYPELHAALLSSQQTLWQNLALHVEAGRPVLAECGGMMCLFDQLVDQAGRSHAMAGLLPGVTRMQSRLAGLGLQEVQLSANTAADGEANSGRLRGHAFHYSSADTPLIPWARASHADGRPGEPIYRRQRLTASYMHFYFPYNPAASAALFSGCSLPCHLPMPC